MAKRRKGWDGVERRQPPLVLVASENEAANQLLTRVLESKGFRVLTAVTAETAVGHISDHLPRAAVLDLSSRGIGASMHVLDRVRQHDDDRVRACRVIVVARSDANRNFSFQSGADAFLLRPFHANDLAAMLVEVLSILPEDRARHRRDMINAGV